MMSSKHKLIVVVFGIVAVAYLVIYVVEQNASNKKLERFADDDDEEEFEEPETDESFQEKPKTEKKPSVEAKSTPPTSQANTTTGKNETKSLADVMRVVSTYVQQKLPGAKEQMSVMKELFTESNLEKLQKLVSVAEIQHFVNSVITGEKEFQPQDSKLALLQAKLDDIKTNLKKTEDEIQALTKEQVKKKEPFNERFQPAGDAPTPQTDEVIEGFENVRHCYASY